MIPPDVASSLRQILPDQQRAADSTQTQAVAAAQRITDVLRDMVPGQRVMAQIQALLPNGSYRAVVGQRDITLALPFAAKAGESLELEVVENNGKLALAVLANRPGSEGAGKLNDSVATTLSQAGKLIGNLLSSINGGDGKRAAPAPLNSNQPLVDDLPKQAANLAPILKDALSKSGVFYEAHQARWVAGQVTTEALRQEPQGKMPPSMPPSPAAVLFSNATPETPLPTMPSATPAPVDQAPSDVINKNSATPETQQARAPVGQLAAEASGPETQQGNPAQKAQDVAVDATKGGKNTEIAPNVRTEQQPASQTTGSPVARDLTPIVQQQLDALATQNYAWQGQVWPGQKLWWEISENPENDRSADQEIAGRWQTRLKLSLPMLGGIDAVLRLRPNGEVDISMTTDSAESESRLREGATALRKQMEATGLNLTQLLVQLEQHGETVE